MEPGFWQGTSFSYDELPTTSPLAVEPETNKQHRQYHDPESVPSMKVSVFWEVAPSSLVEVYRRFGGSYCLHHQDDEKLMVICNKIYSRKYSLLNCS
jgi:hypothetical protein